MSKQYTFQCNRATTSVVSSVATPETPATLLAYNSHRLGGSIYNNSEQYLHVLLDDNTNWAIKIEPYGYLEVPYGCTAAVKGYWSSANGDARATEYT